MTPRPARRWLHAALQLWERAWNEHCAPHQVGWAVGVGGFCACTPLIGLHMWMALGLATLFRLNRVWAFAGSRISFGPLFGMIAFSEIQVAHRVRAGVWVPLRLQAVLAEGRGLLVDWVLGTVLVGGLIAAAVGLAAYLAARRWKGTDGPTRSLAPPVARPRSSESPP